jgi:hypothetical protein
LHEIFLSKTNSTLTGKQCARSSSFKHRCFLWIDACVSSTQLSRPTWSNRAYLNLETLKWQEAFLSKLTELSQGSKMLDKPDSKTDCVLWRYMYVSST